MKTFFLLSALIGFQLMGSPLSAEPKPSDAKALGKELMNNLPGIFSLDAQNRKVPAIRNGNWVLSTKPISLVESFTQQTQAIATLFVKSDNEFIRLMTTEVNEKPGTILDHSNPAYKHLYGELRWTGKLTLSGNDYMVDYDVFRDRQGRVVGAYLVGIPL